MPTMFGHFVTRCAVMAALVLTVIFAAQPTTASLLEAVLAIAVAGLNLVVDTWIEQ